MDHKCIQKVFHIYLLCDAGGVELGGGGGR